LGHPVRLHNAHGAHDSLPLSSTKIRKPLIDLPYGGHRFTLSGTDTSIHSGDGKGNDGEGIWGSRDHSRVSADAGGDNEGSAAATTAMSASVEADINVWVRTNVLALRSL
nr:hypothetical protein [Tanacetum cinerariifolium]